MGVFEDLGWKFIKVFDFVEFGISEFEDFLVRLLGISITDDSLLFKLKFSFMEPVVWTDRFSTFRLPLSSFFIFFGFLESFNFLKFLRFLEESGFLSLHLESWFLFPFLDIAFISLPIFYSR